MENDYMQKQNENVKFQMAESLHKLFEKLDPEGSLHAIGQSFEQTLALMYGSVSRLQSLVAQRDIKIKDMIEMHAGEINQLQQLNLTQQSRIKEMTLQSTHLEERDRRPDYGNE